MRIKNVWANHFVCVKNERLAMRDGSIFLGHREIMCRYNGIEFEAWFGQKGNDDLDRAQMTITGDLKNRIKRFYK